MKRADQDKIKAFITRKRDRFRPPYGRNVIEQERVSIFIATTNLDDWAKDETGGRRFWPVHSEGTIALDEIGALRDHLWAEAVARFRADEQRWLTDYEAELAREEVASRYVGDPWETPISEAIRDRAEVTCEDLLTNVLHVERARQRQGDQLRVGRILKRLGRIKQRVRREGVRITLYVLPTKVPTPGHGLSTSMEGSVARDFAIIAASYDGCPRCPCKNLGAHEIGLRPVQSWLKTVWTPWTALKPLHSCECRLWTLAPASTEQPRACGTSRPIRN
jgi:predicted P-loop ATPase